LMNVSVLSLQEYNLIYNFKFDSVKLGYRNYVRWEKGYRVFEKNLPGFQLTNPQMFWVAYANSYFKRDFGLGLHVLNAQYQFSHVWLKNRPEFREAFNCSELTANEKQQFEILKAVLLKIFRP
jgi:hypothetical protein